MRTSILAYIIAVVGLVMLTFGAWGLFVLNTAEIDIALTDEAIVFGPNRRRPCNDRSGTSPAPATRHSEKYQSSLGGSLKRQMRLPSYLFAACETALPPSWDRLSAPNICSAKPITSDGAPPMASVTALTEALQEAGGSNSLLSGGSVWRRHSTNSSTRATLETMDAKHPPAISTNPRAPKFRKQIIVAVEHSQMAINDTQ